MKYSFDHELTSEINKLIVINSYQIIAANREVEPALDFVQVTRFFCTHKYKNVYYMYA